MASAAHEATNRHEVKVSAVGDGERLLAGGTRAVHDLDLSSWDPAQGPSTGREVAPRVQGRCRLAASSRSQRGPASAAPALDTPRSMLARCLRTGVSECAAGAAGDLHYFCRAGLSLQTRCRWSRWKGTRAASRCELLRCSSGPPGRDGRHRDLRSAVPRVLDEHPSRPYPYVTKGGLAVGQLSNKVNDPKLPVTFSWYTPICRAREEDTTFFNGLAGHVEGLNRHWPQHGL